MSSYFTQVLDEPYYNGNNQFLAVVTNGKVRHENEEARDFDKDAGAKAGLLCIDAENDTVDFIDFHKHSDQGDRYRGVAVVDDFAYIMRTQKDKVDSIVRVAKVNLSTKEVTMLEETGVSVHGTVTPKTFCGHFNFGRPITVENKIIYPPLNSGMVIEFNTDNNKFIVHEVEDNFASIHSVFVPELREVVFFPYGETTDRLLSLNVDTQETKFVQSPTKSAFYHVNTANGKAIGAPLIMDETDNNNFWIYDGNSITSLAYNTNSDTSVSGQRGFKYGTMFANTLYTHSCWDGANDLVMVNLEAGEISVYKTDLPLGSKPVVIDNEVYLLPSVQAGTREVTSDVYKFVEGHLEKVLDTITTNVTSGAINDIDSVNLLTPWRFDIVDDQLDCNFSVVNFTNKSSRIINTKLAFED